MAECFGKCGDRREDANAKPYWCRTCKKKFNAYLGPKLDRDYWTIDLRNGLKEKVYSEKLKVGFKTLHACEDRK